MRPYADGIETVPIYWRLETRLETRDGDQTRDQTKTLRAPQKIAHSQQALETGPSIEVFADGACEPNPGPGAWAFVVYREGKEVHFASGMDLETTNNRMELTAALRALEWITANCPGATCQLHSDSSYTVKGCNEWRHRWKAKGWKRAGDEIPNADLWRLLDMALEMQPMRLTWVRGHSGIAGNERADALASEALEAQAWR